MKLWGSFFLLFAMAGCAFNAADWEPENEGLNVAVEYCKREMLERDPLLGPFWHLSKDFCPCMENRGYLKK